MQKIINYITILLLILITLKVNAQEKEKRDRKADKEKKNKPINVQEIYGLQGRDYRWGVYYRGINPDLRHLNKALEKGGFSKMSRTHSLMGMEMNLRSNGKSFGKIEFGRTNSSLHVFGDTIVKYDLYNFGFSSFYHLIKRPKFIFRGLLGISMSSVKINIDQNIPDGAEFGDVLLSEGSQLGLRLTTFDLHFGFQANFLISRRNAAYIIGFNSGYFQSLTNPSNNWQMQLTEATIKHGPKINPYGFYTGINFSIIFSQELGRKFGSMGIRFKKRSE